MRAVNLVFGKQPQGVHSQTGKQVWNTVKVTTGFTPASDHENRYSAALKPDRPWLKTHTCTHMHTHTQPHLLQWTAAFWKQSHPLLPPSTLWARRLGKHRSQSTDPEPFKRNVLFSVSDVLSGLICLLPTVACWNASDLSGTGHCGAHSKHHSYRLFQARPGVSI